MTETAISPSPTASNCIAILDCGAQYTKVIDRRVRELGVESVIHPLTIAAKDLAGTVSAIILSGGPFSVYEPGAPQCDRAIFDLGIPVLGICYGMQLMVQQLGGQVASLSRKEYGETTIHISPDCPLFTGLDPVQDVLMSHGDSVAQLPPGFRSVGLSPGHDAQGHPVDITAAIAHDTLPFYGLQFHPEVELTVHGGAMLDNFLKRIAHLPGTFDLSDRLDHLLAELRAQVGPHPVFSLVSGGVDSSVVTALLLRALNPDQVYAVHIDTGLMRHNESDLVSNALLALGAKHLTRLDAADTFFNATTTLDDGRPVGPLCQETDPEAKRRIIGDTFFRLIDEQMQAVLTVAGSEGKVFLAQGTLRPDLIESGNRDISQSAHKIKTHHNDVPLIQAQRDKGLVVEPNRDFHKDEVRQIGRLLGLPEALVARQPFPGPGLGVRVLCTKEPFGLAEYDDLNGKLQRVAAQYGLKACLMPVRSVGVQGDGRTYAHLAALECDDFDTPQGWHRVMTAAREIPNQLPGINRLAINLLPQHSPLPQALKTVTPTTLTPNIVAKVQHWDHLVTQGLDEAAKPGVISQALSVLVPVDPAKQGRHALAIRAVVTSDFMTARPAQLGRDLPFDSLRSIAHPVWDPATTSMVLYDVTGKPPATVEWE
jgi:GMP synthase (glutamine-hydrolysing)